MRKIRVFLVLFILSVSTALCFADEIDDVITDAGNYLYKTVESPIVGSIGGEWTVIGFARGNKSIENEYYLKYYNNLCDTLKKNDGILTTKKYTEYSRVVLALSSLGISPTDVLGYNLITPILNFDKTVYQGINGAIFALLAIDANNFGNKDYDGAREKYIGYILERELDGGGFSLSGQGGAEPDITAMALQALSKYKNRESVKTAIDDSLAVMSKIQNNSGGFSTGGIENTESDVQMLVALCELGISVDDSRFVKDGKTIVDNLLTYYQKGNGFLHSKDEDGQNLMSTEQCFYGLVAYKRFLDGKNSLYNMTDSLKIEVADEDTNNGLPNKNGDVKKLDIINSEASFEDIEDSKSRLAIEELNKRGIVNGQAPGKFFPDSTMTRAEFSKIVVCGLGLPMKGSNSFSDVIDDDWFKDYINSAVSYGITQGVSKTCFNPFGTITRQEAGVMISRCAALCGMDTKMDRDSIRNVLSGFVDYNDVALWAGEAMAFCYSTDILPSSDLEILPTAAITRGEIAEILYNLLYQSKLL